MYYKAKLFKAKLLTYAEKIKVQYSSNKDIRNLKNWIEKNEISYNISYLFTDTSINSRNSRFKYKDYTVYTLNLFPALTIKKIDNKLLNTQINTCPFCGYCKDICIGLMKNAPKNMVSQLKKTLLIFDNPDMLKKEIRKIIDKNRHKLNKIFFRLNNYSDIAWEEIKFKNINLFENQEYNIFEEFSKVMFYDYTKIKDRFIKYIKGELPENYFLTYSYDKKNKKDYFFVIRFIKYYKIKIKKAVSFAFIVKEKNKIINNLKNEYKNIDIIDGDECDIRILDLNHEKPIKAVLLEYNTNTGLSKDKAHESKYYLRTWELKQKLKELDKIASNIKVDI
jgi:hypothetical protein